MTPTRSAQGIPGGSWLRPRAALAVLCAAVIAAACGSAPPVHLHSLLPVQPPAVSDGSAVAAQQTLIIAMAPIGVPAQVDQPQWLVRLADGSLASLEQERWASPLGGELRQALVERLAVRHGIVEAQVAETPPTARVVINLLRFDSTPGREALVEGSWLIQPQPGSSDATASRCSWTFRQPAVGGFDALAEAHRRQRGWREIVPADPAPPSYAV